MRRVSSDELRKRLDLFEEACVRRGVRLTAQRLTVFTCLARSPAHPDAELLHREVVRHLPRISLDTVYRNLWLFVEMGVAGVLTPSHGRHRFEVRFEQHHHFVCRSCGTVADVSAPALDRLPRPETLAALGEVEAATVEFRGLCRACLKSSQTKLRAHATK
ncbi:transcriptional repressor [Candidatus Ozemobacteraceae bacterium]|nr:transcriptional repressor [Candidatus Ozemobacteraceae bacterium]